MKDLRRLLPYLARYKRRLALGMASLLAAKLAAVLVPQVLRMTVDDLTVSVTLRKLAIYAGLIVGISVVDAKALTPFALEEIIAGREAAFEQASQDAMPASKPQEKPGEVADPQRGFHIIQVVYIITAEFGKLRLGKFVAQTNLAVASAGNSTTSAETESPYTALVKIVIVVLVAVE